MLKKSLKIFFLHILTVVQCPETNDFVLFIPNTRSESSCGQLHKRNMLKEHVLLLKLLLFYKLFCQENVKCQILLQVLHIDEP